MNQEGAEYVKGDAVYFAIKPAQFAWGERRTIAAEADRKFQPLKFGVPSTVAGFLVLSIAVADDEVFGNSLGVPIELFTSASTFPQPRWPELGPGRAVTFELRAPHSPPVPLLRWWQRLWNWITRERPALPSPPVFQGAFYGVNR